ncbi:hypothetical protein B7987_00165, partial [Staphylococcus aureus]
MPGNCSGTPKLFSFILIISRVLSALQIGNVILTPSLKVIESGHFHTDFSLISMFNKKEFLSILSTSQLKEDALVIFKDDFFEPTTVDQNYYFINKLSQKADRTL